MSTLPKIHNASIPISTRPYRFRCPAKHELDCIAVPSAVMEGTVKWFNNGKGYGFIGRDDGPDVFVHYTGIVGEGYRSLNEGDSVKFEIVQGPKGPQAVNVIKLS